MISLRIKMMNCSVKSVIIKLCVGVLAVAVCSHLMVTLQGSWSGERRLRLIPRYVTQKEIRGPTYHVHHQILDDSETPSEKTILSPGGSFKNTRKRLQPKYLLPASWQTNRKVSSSSPEGWFQ